MNKLLCAAFLFLTAGAGIAQTNTAAPGSQSTDGSNKLVKESQSAAGLLNREQFVDFPMNADSVSGILGIPYVRGDYRGDDNAWIWSFETGLQITYYQTADGGAGILFVYDKTDGKIDNMPLGLTLNGSQFDECRYKFEKYHAQHYQDSKEVSDMESRAFEVITFKKGKYFVKLSFDNNIDLSSIEIATEAIE